MELPSSPQMTRILTWLVASTHDMGPKVLLKVLDSLVFLIAFFIYFISICKYANMLWFEPCCPNFI